MSATEAPEIVLIAYDAPPTIGGIQTHFAGLARGFVENGVRCLALAPRVPGCEEFDRSFVCPIIRVGDLRKGVYALAAARQLRYLAHKLPPPRMVIALNTLPAGLAYVLARVRQWAPLGITG
ncbi:MAG: hypothetical protein H5T86_07935, partial [Armatimonadetes bacterium]|nr:hypothetical protein [Armatimonadota bacterium]